MRAYRVTYTNGDAYITSANGTLKEFTDYITQSYHTEENPVTGKETRLYVATVEEVINLEMKITYIKTCDNCGKPHQDQDEILCNECKPKRRI